MDTKPPVRRVVKVTKHEYNNGSHIPAFLTGAVIGVVCGFWIAVKFADFVIELETKAKTSVKVY